MLLSPKRGIGRGPTVRTAIFVVGAPLVFAGCSSRPAAVRPPAINASQAGSQAIEMYDKNGDGIIAGDELDRAPALTEAMPRLDTNADKGVSADEIAARVNSWKDTQLGMTSIRCH